MDLIVVGAGIAGSSVARAARDRGHKVTVISRGLPASTAAVAVMRHSWHRGAELPMAVRTLALYRQWGIPLVHGAIVSNARTPDAIRWDDDFHALDPVAPLVTPDIEADVTGLYQQWVRFATRPAIHADHVIDCRGWTADRTDLRPSYGATLVTTNTRLWTAAIHKMRVHHIRPYHSLVAARLPGQIRIGSSTGRDIASAVEQVKTMLGHAEEVGIVGQSGDWRIDAGIRARPVKGAAWYTTSPPAMRGLYRTGYALAPAYAERLITHLENR